jgi:beta-lactamase regulating signal transducer with metallopeptidase domain
LSKHIVPVTTPAATGVTATNAAPVEVVISAAKHADAIPGRVTWRSIALGTWIAVTLVILIRIAFASMRLSRDVRRMQVVQEPRVTQLLRQCSEELAVRQRVTLLASDDLPAPALMGVFRPRLLLPTRVLETFEPAELRLILLHELAHLKRHDVLVNWLVALLQAAHWFNPVLWLAFARLRADRELATDELVLRRTSDAGERGAYGETILKLLDSLTRQPEHQSRIAAAGAVGILEKAHLLRRRITMIARFDSVPSRRWTLPAAAGMLLLAAFGLTDAVRGDTPASPPQSGPTLQLAGASSSSSPATRPSEAKRGGPDEQLNRMIDDAWAKLLAKSPKPSRAEITAAMNELGKEIERQRLFFSPQGKPANQKQVDESVAQARATFSERFDGDTAPPPQAGDATLAARAKLGEKLPEVKFDSTAFSDTVDFLRDVTKLNIFVDWRVLESAGVDRNSPVTISLKDVATERALRYVLRDVGGGGVKLDFAVIDGIVTISTEEALAADTSVRVYNIAALLKAMPTTMPVGTDEQVMLASKIERVIETVREAVAPDSWREAGGPTGAIRELNGKLVVTQTEANHAAIQKLLEELTAGQDDAVAARGH